MTFCMQTIIMETLGKLGKSLENGEVHLNLPSPKLSTSSATPSRMVVFSIPVWISLPNSAHTQSHKNRDCCPVWRFILSTKKRGWRPTAQHSKETELPQRIPNVTTLSEAGIKLRPKIWLDISFWFSFLWNVKNWNDFWTTFSFKNASRCVAKYYSHSYFLVVITVLLVQSSRSTR